MVCVVQPLAGVQPAEPWAPGGLEAADVARCHDCLAYVNHLCAFNPSGWACALCGTQNDFAAAANRRYMGGPQARAALPELAPAAVDALGSLFEGDAADEVRPQTALLPMQLNAAILRARKLQLSGAVFVLCQYWVFFCLPSRSPPPRTPSRCSPAASPQKSRPRPCAWLW